jgi:glycosyltransferase involved in cell wall biosynthesis
LHAVLLSPNPAATMGGVERFVAMLDAALRSAGWDTTVVGPTVQVPELAARAGCGPSLRALSAIRGARALRPDLVVSNGFLGGPCGCPRIHVFHGTMIRHVAAGATGSRRYRLREAVGGAVPEALCGRGATTVAVSAPTAAELRKLYLQKVDAVIPNGVDTDLFGPGDRAAARRVFGLDTAGRFALFVGRFEHRKGADLVVDACAAAGFELVVAGPSAPGSAVALGVLAPAQLADAYRAADCVVFPTRYEACSFVVLEALASGVPLLTTDIAWMSDFLRACPGYRRFVVQPSVRSVAGALADLDRGDHAAALDAARSFVCANNGLEAFGRAWTRLAASVAGLGPTSG